MKSLELPVEKINEELDRMPNIIIGKDPNNKKKHPIIGEPMLSLSMLKIMFNIVRVVLKLRIFQKVWENKGITLKMKCIAYLILI